MKKRVLSLVLAMIMLMSLGTGMMTREEADDAVQTVAPSAEPEATGEPEPSEGPEATEEPASTEEPAATVEPEVTGEPAATEVPEATEEPAATEAPVEDGGVDAEEEPAGEPKAMTLSLGEGSPIAPIAAVFPFTADDLRAGYYEKMAS